MKILVMIENYRRILFVNPEPDFQLKNVRKSLFHSVLFLILHFALISLIINSIRITSRLDTLLFQSAIYILQMISVILIVLLEKEKLQSIGITKINLMKSSILGTFLGVNLFIFYILTTKSDKTIMSWESLLMFIEFVIVGFAEEITFRGFLQSRLIAWKGVKIGCLFTALIYSFYHLPINLFYGMNIETAIRECINLFPISLLFGYIMIKTKNIVTTSILHSFLNWTIN